MSFLGRVCAVALAAALAAHAARLFDLAMSFGHAVAALLGLGIAASALGFALWIIQGQLENDIDS